MTQDSIPMRASVLPALSTEMAFVIVSRQSFNPPVSGIADAYSATRRMIITTTRG